MEAQKQEVVKHDWKTEGSSWNFLRFQYFNVDDRN